MGGGIDDSGGGEEAECRGGGCEGCKVLEDESVGGCGGEVVFLGHSDYVSR